MNLYNHYQMQKLYFKKKKDLSFHLLLINVAKFKERKKTSLKTIFLRIKEMTEKLMESIV